MESMGISSSSVFVRNSMLLLLLCRKGESHEEDVTYMIAIVVVVSRNSQWCLFVGICPLQSRVAELSLTGLDCFRRRRKERKEFRIAVCPVYRPFWPRQCGQSSAPAKDAIFSNERVMDRIFIASHRMFVAQPVLLLDGFGWGFSQLGSICLCLWR